MDALKQFYARLAEKKNKKIQDYLGLTHWIDLYGLSDEPICVIESANVSDVHDDIINNAEGTHRRGHGDMVVSTIKLSSSAENIHYFDVTKTKRRDIYDYCIENGIRIVTESLGWYDEAYDYYYQDDDEYAIENGLILLTSGGNKGQNGEDARANNNDFKDIGAYGLENGQLVYQTYSNANDHIDYISLVGRMITYKDEDGRIRNNAFFGGTSEASPTFATQLRYALPYLREQLGHEPTREEVFKFVDANTYDTGDSNRRDGKGILLLPISNPDLYKRHERNKMAIQMIKPNGKKTYVHDSSVEIKLREGYKLV